MKAQSNQPVERHQYDEVVRENERLRALVDGMLLYNGEFEGRICQALGLPQKSSLEAIIGRVEDIREGRR